MKSNYERNRFRLKYIGISAVFLLLLLVFGYLTFGKSWRLIWIETGLGVVFAIIVYVIAYRAVDQAYSEMEHISEAMIDVLEDSEYTDSEEYRAGTVGILYTNFYKMVSSLKKSKIKEQEEKIFLRDIISDISHQLKTPLASLNVFMDLLLDEKVPDADKQKQMLVESKNQLNRMEWMVLSMLKLARIEAGAIQFEKQAADLSTLLLQAAEGVQYLTKERKQELILKCEDGVILVCDGDWLVEAVINLLKNASDYSEENRRIWLEVEENKLYTRIYVKDEGMGISEQELPNIFKRFYRVHQEVNPNSVGIGLSLTKSIVEGMGGSIKVRSEEGSGTCFTITFVR